MPPASPPATNEARGRRPKSAVKRAAILDAARELFVREGVDHVSMDAVAASAEVSKATLYDHFGSKQLLFSAILTDVSKSLHESVDEALRRHFDDAEIQTLLQLENALTQFAFELGMVMTGSQGYGGVLTLVNQRRWQTSVPVDDVSTEPVVLALATRFDRFVHAELLDINDCRTAALHFGALTLLLANDDQPDPRSVDEDRLHDVIASGVHTFIRAFGV